MGKIKIYNNEQLWNVMVACFNYDDYDDLTKEFQRNYNKWALVEDLEFVKKMFIVLKSLTPKDSDGYKILLEWQKQVKELFGDE